MPNRSSELLRLSKEAQELSDYIATLKSKKNKVSNEAEKDRLTEEIKLRQYQALFYFEKIENLSGASKKKG